MEKIFMLLMLLIPAMTFAGCSDMNDDPQTEVPDTPDNLGGDDNNDDEPGTINPSNGKILIAYFSRWGNTNYPADVDASTGASIIVSGGNRRGTTEVVADYIQVAVGGDIHLIETSDPYPVDFDDMRDLSHSEQANETRPALKNQIENMAQYETVFIGYPIWWDLAPHIINTFIESHDLKGKTVIPFATSGGSTLAGSAVALKKTYPALNWKEGRLLNRADEKTLRAWIEKLGF